MLTIVNRTVSGLEKTADDWELYDIEGRNACAQRLNQAFMDIVNEGASRKEVERRMEEVCDRPINSGFGAADTEGRSMVWSLCNKVFGRE